MDFWRFSSSFLFLKSNIRLWRRRALPLSPDLFSFCFWENRKAGEMAFHRPFPHRFQSAAAPLRLYLLENTPLVWRWETETIVYVSTPCGATAPAHAVTHKVLKNIDVNSSLVKSVFKQKKKRLLNRVAVARKSRLKTSWKNTAVNSLHRAAQLPRRFSDAAFTSKRHSVAQKKNAKQESK